MLHFYNFFANISIGIVENLKDIINYEFFCRVSLDYLHRVFESSNELERKYSVLSVKQPPLNDYLHPKYSLPPIEIDVEEEKVLYSNCFFFFLQ